MIQITSTDLKIAFDFYLFLKQGLYSSRGRIYVAVVDQELAM